jgi:hypothetical protein
MLVPYVTVIYGQLDQRNVDFGRYPCINSSGREGEQPWLEISKN